MKTGFAYSIIGPSTNLMVKTTLVTMQAPALRLVHDILRLLLREVLLSLRRYSLVHGLPAICIICQSALVDRLRTFCGAQGCALL